MDVRRIQVTGGASFAVTLPKEWVEGAGLARGDVVAMAPQSDGSLLITAGSQRRAPPVRAEVDVGALGPESTFRRVVGAYLAGHDIIVVRTKRPMSPAIRKALQQTARRIVGLEIVEEDAHTVTLQDFMDPGEFQMLKGLRRMEAITRGMQTDALHAASGEVPDDLEERDDEVDKLYWMLNKQYHALLRDPSYGHKMGVTAVEALNLLLVARIVERSADHARRIAENLVALRGGAAVERVESRIERQARRALDLFSGALAAFHAKDANAADRLIEEARAFQRSQEGVAREALSLGGENILHVALALDSIARTAAYASDIAETAINVAA